MPTENTDTPPAPGKFCVRHWSWLCQAGQGKCQQQARLADRLAAVTAERDRLAARIAAVRDLCTSVHMFPGETGPAGHRDGMETMANQVWDLLDEDGQQ